MSYHCGIGPGMVALGLTPCEPHIDCDGCGAQIRIVDGPPRWFLDGKAKPGWRIVRTGETRRDYCPKCRAQAEET